MQSNGELAILRDNGGHCSQNVSARHCVKESHQIIVPLDIGFCARRNPMLVECLPQLGHALHARLSEHKALAIKVNATDANSKKTPKRR